MRAAETSPEAKRGESDPDRSTKRRVRGKDLRRWLRYFAVLPLIAVFSRVPLAFSRPLGTIIGAIGWALAGENRRRAMENLRAALGKEKSERELSALCRAVFRNTSINLFELLAIYRWPPEKIRRRFALEEGFRQIAEGLPAGGVGLTAHLGNWELFGILLSVYMPGRVFPVAKRIYFPKFQEMVEKFRRSVGLEVIYTDESPRRQIETIQAGKIVALLCDQNLKVLNGVFVDFFGRPAYTSTAPVHLALTTGAPLALGSLVRVRKGYRVIFRRIPLVETGRKEEDLLENTRRWTEALEEDVRGYLDQWVWFHRRWRRRPEEGPRKLQ
jgi:Kdo2-lipid IVA lauroyltransferase/acyltransferase